MRIENVTYAEKMVNKIIERIANMIAEIPGFPPFSDMKLSHLEVERKTKEVFFQRFPVIQSVEKEIDIAIIFHYIAKDDDHKHAMVTVEEFDGITMAKLNDGVRSGQIVLNPIVKHWVDKLKTLLSTKKKSLHYYSVNGVYTFLSRNHTDLASFVEVDPYLSSKKEEDLFNRFDFRYQDTSFGYIDYVNSVLAFFLCIRHPGDDIVDPSNQQRYWGYDSIAGINLPEYRANLIFQYFYLLERNNHPELPIEESKGKVMDRIKQEADTIVETYLPDILKAEKLSGFTKGIEEFMQE